MRFELFTLPILAAIAEAAAIKSASSSVCTTCPVTIQDTASAISSIMSQMSLQSPKVVMTTTSITGSPVAATGVAKMTTAAPSSVSSASAITSYKTSSAVSSSKPTSAASSSSSSRKSSSSTVSSSTSSKRRQRRGTSTLTSSSTTTTPASNACATQANFGYTYTPSNPAPSAFLKDSTLRAQYMSATVPSNYVWRYAGFYASLSQPGYLFYTELSSYNTTQCAAICDANTACKGFNIYFERTPSLLPGDGCANPAPQVGVKCGFYGQAISEANAVNVGSWRSSFAVVITGANGYAKQ